MSSGQVSLLQISFIPGGKRRIVSLCYILYCSAKTLEQDIVLSVEVVSPLNQIYKIFTIQVSPSLQRSVYVLLCSAIKKLFKKLDNYDKLWGTFLHGKLIYSSSFLVARTSHNVVGFILPICKCHQENACLYIV